MASRRRVARLRAFLEAHAAATGAVSLYAAAIDVGRAQDVRATALVTFNGFLVAAIAVLSSAFFQTITGEAVFLGMLGICGSLTLFATIFALTSIGDGGGAAGHDIEAQEIARLAARLGAYRVGFLCSGLGAASLAGLIGGLIGYGVG